MSRIFSQVNLLSNTVSMLVSVQLNGPSVDSFHIIYYHLFLFAPVAWHLLQNKCFCHLSPYFSKSGCSKVLRKISPSILILAIVYSTNFFKPFFFEAVVTLNLTAFLVLTTLFIRQASTHSLCHLAHILTDVSFHRGSSAHLQGLHERGRRQRNQPSWEVRQCWSDSTSSKRTCWGKESRRRDRRNEWGREWTDKKNKTWSSVSNSSFK